MRTSIEKLPWVIFDIDGTLADIKHRLHHIKQSPKDWDSFNKLMDHDTLKEEVYWLLQRCFDAGFNIALVSGRQERYRSVTVKWLETRGINFEELHMRPIGDKRSDWEVKEEILINEFLKPRRKIFFVVDDRDAVVAMWRQHNLTCFQCQKGDY